MRHRVQALVVALFGLLVAAVPGFAHHSVTAEFDPSKTFVVTGVLSRLEWSNPHIYYFVDAKDPDTGKVETWAFEGNPPGFLHKAGVRKTDWKIGETVTVTAVPAKDGSKHLGFGKEIKYADGHVIELRVGGE
jgi:hypothetical protein